MTRRKDATSKTGKPKPKLGTGHHTPVTNQPHPVGKIKSSRFEPPHHGTDKNVEALGDGLEQVANHQHLSLLAAANAKLFTPPQLTSVADVGIASFGAAPAPANLGVPDNRVEITDTTAYPWRVQCSLLIVAADNSIWHGTGWFISPRTLITAGHCVYITGSPIPERNGWVKNVKVTPGRNGQQAPYGIVTSTTFRAVTGWTENGDENFDYGAIIVPTPLGETIGWLGIGVYTDDDLMNATANISGYPIDKPEGTQWYASNTIAYVDDYKVYYEIDTEEGESGSAVYLASGQQRVAFAVHAYGGSTTNSGTRITTDAYQNMLSWKQ
jgi:V8-like Glu-specific endopeptidase